MKLSIQQLHDSIWQIELQSLAFWRQKAVRFLQIVLMVVRDVSRGMLTLRAMSLVYTTLLSFVPLLAVSFSVLKGFGVHNQIEPLLLNLLEPLGTKSVEITSNIVGFVDNMKIGVLGALGLGVLMFTVVSLIQKIESAFNYTWRIKTVRSLSQRFSSYLSVIMVGPVLVFSAIGITASLRNQAIIDAINALPYAGEFIALAGKLLPYGLIILAFTLVYLLVPNTRVKLKSALYGAIVAGILWRWTGLLFASFAGGSTSYTAIYSGFAILLLFMIWLYLGWLILLIGASIAFYHQHPEKVQWDDESIAISAVMRENLAFQLMLEIGLQYSLPDGFVPTRKNLAARLKIPQVMTVGMLNNLESFGLIARSAEIESRYLLLQDSEKIKLIDILRAARNADDKGLQNQLQKAAVVSQLQLDIERSLQQLLAEKTLKDLILQSRDPVNENSIV